MTTAPRVDQVLHNLEYGDAISDEARLIRDRLRAQGMRSTIFAENVAPRLAGEGEPFSDSVLAGADGVIYHHAIGGDLAARVARSPSRSALLYHNVTPPEFFAPYAPSFAALLAAGRDELARIAARFDVLAADSHYSASELAALAHREVSVLPFPVDMRRFECLPDAGILGRTQRGARWLSVGRIAPNKGLHRVVASFRAFLAWDPEATLALVGRYVGTDAYHLSLRSELLRLGIEDRVTLTGSVDDAELLAWYRSSDVYLGLSEHEGFCVPLVEAMMFDLPVVASASSAMPETLGSAGLIVEEEATALEIASLVATLLGDADLRHAVIAAQRARREDFSAHRVAPPIDALVARLIARDGTPPAPREGP